MTTAVQTALLPKAAPSTVSLSETVALPGAVSGAPTNDVSKPAPKRRRRATIVLPVLAVAVLGAASIAFVAGRGKETTDDAQVEGHVVSVSPRLAGQVARVLVKDNQSVKEGDLLVELDNRDFVARLAAARADLAAAKAQLHAAQTQLGVTTKAADSELIVARAGIAQASAVRGSSRAAIDQAEADVAAAEARQRLASTEFQRADFLFKSAAISQAAEDTAKTVLDEANASLSQAHAHLTSAKSGLDNSAGSIESARGRLIAAQSGPEQIESQRAQAELAEARVEQAQAAVDQAELNLSYTKVKAATPGVVSRRSVEVGQTVSPDRPLLALVPLDDTWVVANFKEDQIAEMKDGQAARISIDTFSRHDLLGHVESLAGGTGSRFSLLPPDNASGNFTKVVQRLPVLIRLDPQNDVTLRPGMSAAVTVFTK
jgi:membrane fusion protein (multidrug efflux system)